MRKLIVIIAAVLIWAGAIVLYIQNRPPSRPGVVKPQPPIVLGSGEHRGEFVAYLQERSPLSEKSALTEKLRASAATTQPDYDLNKETFAIYVPEAPAQPKKPLGIIDWLNYKNSPGVPLTWKKLLDQHNLIFIVGTSINHPDWVRAGLALDAVHNLRKFYPIDERRIYLFSMNPVEHYFGQQMGLTLPDAFDGFVYIMNIRYFRPVFDPDQHGIHPPAIPMPDPQSLALAKTRRHVLISEAGAKTTVPLYYAAYQHDGFSQMMYTEVSLTDDVHYPNLSTPWMEKVLTFLDAPATEPTTQALPQ